MQMKYKYKYNTNTKPDLLSVVLEYNIESVWFELTVGLELEPNSAPPSPPPPQE